MEIMYLYPLSLGNWTDDRLEARLLEEADLGTGSPSRMVSRDEKAQVHFIYHIKINRFKSYKQVNNPTAKINLTQIVDVLINIS